MRFVSYVSFLAPGIQVWFDLIRNNSFVSFSLSLISKITTRYSFETNKKPEKKAKLSPIMKYLVTNRERESIKKKRRVKNFNYLK